MAGRYEIPSRRPPGGSAAWDAAAIVVLRAMLNTYHALTVSEIEARASDRTWNAILWPWPIDPHHFTNARTALFAAGEIEPTSLPTRSHADPITTWSRVPVRGLRRSIEAAAARKRLLTARHAGWAHRGGAGRGLIGKAGEDAVHAAMTDPSSQLARVSGSTSELLGIPLLGEVDDSAFYVDVDNGTPTAITVMVEVKNARSWYYADHPDLHRFLSKAAHLQAQRPDILIFPIFVCRRVHFKLWELGESQGFLPARVLQQLVLPDSELDQDVLSEVIDGLGFQDLRLGNAPTSRHRGIFATSLPKRARAYAERWQASHGVYLP